MAAFLDRQLRLEQYGTVESAGITLDGNVGWWCGQPAGGLRFAAR
jgi:hypothetical protein